MGVKLFLIVIGCVALIMSGIVYLITEVNPTHLASDAHYFSIGEYVAVIALFLAFVQLVQPIHEFRLRVRGVKELSVFLSLILCASYVIVAACLPYFTKSDWSLAENPGYWQILAGIEIVAVALYLLWASQLLVVFDKDNYARYYGRSESFIARGNDEDLRKLGDEIYESIDDIFEYAKEFWNERDLLLSTTGTSRDAPQYGAAATALLDVLSDRDFCRLLVTRVPATAYKCIEEATKQGARKIGEPLIDQIVNQAFCNKDSILFKEADYSGLGFRKSFTKLVFGNHRFVSLYRPLTAWSYRDRENARDWQVEIYMSALNESIQSYYQSRDFETYQSYLLGAEDVVTGMARRAIHQIEDVGENDLTGSNATSILTRISIGLSNILDTVKENDALLPNYNFDVENYDMFRDNSIYGAISNILYKFMEALSQSKAHDSLVHTLFMHIWMEIFPRNEEPSRAEREIGKRLSIALRDKIDENLDPESPFYPAITRLLITLNGLPTPEILATENARNEFLRDFYAKLRGNFIALEQNYPDIAADMLPKDVLYDKERRVLVKKGLRNRQQIFELT
ncbi:MAG TPA: hypothetical protein VGH91_05010 [Gammaproteobacteria bacterium]|jgi:hypothetical protein